MKFFTPIALALAVLLMSGCVPAGQTSQTPVDSPDGKALYAAYCAACHGADGRNDRGAALGAMRLSGANALTPADWNRLVLNGRAQMPAFQNRLSASQLDALRSYVRQLTAQP